MTVAIAQSRGGGARARRSSTAVATSAVPVDHSGLYSISIARPAMAEAQAEAETAAAELRKQGGGAEAALSISRSLSMVSVRRTERVPASCSAVAPSASSAPTRAPECSSASTHELAPTAEASCRGVAPPNRVDVAFAFAPRVTNNFATASWPATMAACRAGTSVAGAATTPHHSVLSPASDASGGACF